MKKLSTAALAGAFTLSLAFSASAAESQEATFVVGADDFQVNGQEMAMEKSVFIENDRAYAPLRYLMPALGLGHENVAMDVETRAITLSQGEQSVVLTAGSDRLIVNGEEVEMGVAPKFSESCVMAPVRFISEAFGFSVSWNQEEQAVVISKSCTGDVEEEIAEEEAADVEADADEATEEETDADEAADVDADADEATEEEGDADEAVDVDADADEATEEETTADEAADVDADADEATEEEADADGEKA
ncbi:copper amine oxidase N-terminal domain-containing protein [Heliorestis convoluta]|uniref:Copper amine oxidase N-terminal domain-containing protein n=1 Tax=Heliorestis convoluta TaxID=356322 RepID=A0A5Q2MXX8_9FIRM|nr:copper amine oxidase N-terminal domain-containing protein [Heliorestis convoluta]QGG47457.1 copper amine oxidase N-terminal domain-containing protein [Heliorestis convoluta]